MTPSAYAFTLGLMKTLITAVLLALSTNACTEIVSNETAPASAECTLEWPSVFPEDAGPIVQIPYDNGLIETCLRADDAGDYICKPAPGHCSYATECLSTRPAPFQVTSDTGRLVMLPWADGGVETCQQYEGAGYLCTPPIGQCYGPNDLP